MNKPYLLIVFCIVLFWSGGCSNNAEVTPSQEYFIKFKVDGVQKTYSHSFIAPFIFHYDQNGPIFNATILVLDEGSPGTSNFINIITRNEEAFEAGKDYLMQDAILYKSVKLPRISFTWADENGNIYNAVLLQSAYPGLTVNDDAQIRLTTITDDFVEGTFSARLFGSADTLPERLEKEVLITEGSFKLKRTDT
jgi:hypothetical protein